MDKTETGQDREMELPNSEKFSISWVLGGGDIVIVTSVQCFCGFWHNHSMFFVGFGTSCWPLIGRKCTVSVSKSFQVRSSLHKKQSWSTHILLHEVQKLMNSHIYAHLPGFSFHTSGRGGECPPPLSQGVDSPDQGGNGPWIIHDKL